MAQTGIDTSQLERLNSRIMRLASTEFPEESKKFLNTERNKLRKLMRQEIKSRTAKKTGNLSRGIRGKSARKTGDTYEARVYNKAPHAWLVEHGHRIVGHRPNRTDTGKTAEGRRYASAAIAAMRETYPDDVEEFITKICEEALR